MLLQKTCEKNALKKTKEVVRMSMLIARMQKMVLLQSFKSTIK